jgi:CDP-6-deoxy-D-xylo-4-hexulose-3-dehydrase
VSSFALPFLFREKGRKIQFQRLINDAGIESRPLISGNLLRQPFLSQNYDPAGYPNADFLHTNAFYIGNNQFVNEERLDTINELMDDFFSSKLDRGKNVNNKGIGNR